MEADDLMRCAYCNKAQMEKEIAVDQCCAYCGSRRFLLVSRLTDEEMGVLVQRGYNPDKYGWTHYPDPQ